MILLLFNTDITLPLTNPVLKFLTILLIILFAPILLNKVKIPHLLGLIIAGAIIGPYGVNLITRDSSIILSGTAGLLYIMFLAGLEIDMVDFKRNVVKSTTLGLLGFSIPMILGTITGLYLLNYSLMTSVLLASMFSSHTLITYPMVSKLGITKDTAVNITVGSTLITNVLALLVLAVVVGMTSGDGNSNVFFTLALSFVLFSSVVMVLFPWISRWFFKRYDDNVSQYIFVLSMVFLGAALFEFGGIEGIIGAFLAGLALNRLVPRTSPLMNRIDFVGNAIFIPFFLLSVGMLIDFRAFINDMHTLYVAAAMSVVATVGKYLPAWITQKIFRFSVNQRRIIFGLTNAQAAATLAAVLVGYNVIIGESPNGEPVRLLSESILNGTIIMILVTCTIASFETQRGAESMARDENADIGEGEADHDEKILIPLNNPHTVDELIHLSSMVRSKNIASGLYALHVINNNSDFKNESTVKNARKILEKASITAASADIHLTELLRYDLNIVNGISNVIKEHNITDLVLGLHLQNRISESFLGDLTEGVLAKSNITTLIYKPVQPIATIKRHMVVMPENAEREVGFPFWLLKCWNIARNSGAKLVFYGDEKSLDFVRDIHQKHPIDAEFISFEDWDDFLVLSRDVRIDDNLIIVLSRKNKPSYHQNMVNVPKYLNKYFTQNSFLLIYPMQVNEEYIKKMELNYPSLLEPIESLDSIGRNIAGLFKRKQ